MGYYELEYANGKWYACDINATADEESVICNDVDRCVCIDKAESMGYTWAGA